MSWSLTSSGKTVTFTNCWRVPCQMNSVLSAFNFSRFDDIHLSMSATHARRRFVAVCWSRAAQLAYVCISSAYAWMQTLWSAAIFKTSAEYRANNRGPKTNPCGTPQRRHCDDDFWPAKATTCVLSDRNEVSHWSAVPPTLYDNSSRGSRITWLTVSKVAL